MTTLTMADRNRLRKKQNRLIRLARLQAQPFGLRISDHPGSPTLEQLETLIFPEWEGDIDRAIEWFDH